MSILFKYSEEFKKEIVSEIMSGKTTISEVRRIHNIGGNMTIGRWMKHYGKSGNLVKDKLHKHDNVMSNLTLEQAKAKIKELEKQAKDMRSEMNGYRLESLFYKTMVDVAEENHGIDIKKKIGFQLLTNSKEANK